MNPVDPKMLEAYGNLGAIMNPVDPKMLEAYGNLGAMATICLVFIISIMVGGRLYSKSFDKMITAHEKERDRVNIAYIEERNIARKDYIAALDKVINRVERVHDKVEKIECIRNHRNLNL